MQQGLICGVKNLRLIDDVIIITEGIWNENEVADDVNSDSSCH